MQFSQTKMRKKLCDASKQRYGISYAMQPNKDMGGIIALSYIWNEGDKKQKLFVQKHLLYFEDGQFGT